MPLTQKLYTDAQMAVSVPAGMRTLFNGYRDGTADSSPSLRWHNPDGSFQNIGQVQKQSFIIHVGPQRDIKTIAQLQTYINRFGSPHPPGSYYYGVQFDAGEYTGNLTVTDKNIVLMGVSDSESAVRIHGTISLANTTLAHVRYMRIYGRLYLNRILYSLLHGIKFAQLQAYYVSSLQGSNMSYFCQESDAIGAYGILLNLGTTAEFSGLSIQDTSITHQACLVVSYNSSVIIRGTALPITSNSKRILAATNSSSAYIFSQLQLQGIGCTVQAAQDSFMYVIQQIYPSTADISFSPAVNTNGNSNSFLIHRGFTDTKQE